MPVTPRRILDTRSTKAASALGVTRLHVAGVAGVPTSGASVVVLTVTVSAPTAGGYLTAFADGASRPRTSNVSFVAGQSIADEIYAPIGADGSVALYNGSRGSIQLIVDVSGYFAVQQDSIDGGFVSTPPTRLLDTRIGLGGHVIPGRSTLNWSVLGHGPLPASGVSAVLFNLTVVAPTAGGYVTAYRDVDKKPPTSNVSFAARRTTGNLVVVDVDGGGGDTGISIYNGSTGATQVIADVEGYFTAGTPVVAGAFVPMYGTRQLAGRSERGGTDFTVPGVNAHSPATAVLNVTVSAPRAKGYATVFSANTARPATSTLDFSPGSTTAGMAVVVTNGSPPQIHNGSTGAARFTVDQFGYYIGGSDTASIAGTATDASTGKAVAGVRVIAYQYDYFGDDEDWFAYITTTTAADGTYRLSGLLAGKQYWACFDTRSVAAGASSTGYAAQCYDHVAWSTPGSFDDDPGAKLFSVFGGKSITGIDANLTPIPVGGIAGRVTAAGGVPIAQVAVTISHIDPGWVLDTETDSAGNFSVDTLPPGSYTVCLHPTTPSSTALPYGYLDQCEAAPIAVPAGSIKRADATLVAGGGISGRVTTASDVQIHFGGAYVFPLFGTSRSSGVPLDDDGSYTVGGLAPGPYAVCFTGGDSDLNPPYGYVSQCYRDVVWADTGQGPPAGTTPVRVTAGATTSGIEATLASAGAISGTATTSTGAKLVRVAVYVLDNSTGRPVDVRATQTDYDGTYSIVGLTPSTQYTVCFDGRDAGDPPDQGYQSSCWQGIAWSGSLTAVPDGLSPVVVTSGANHAGVNAALTKS